MKRLLILLGCCVVLSCLSGCHNGAGGVEVIIDNGGEFPEFLVGRWVADGHGWEFVFEEDGKISSAVINFGRMTVTPGQPNPITKRWAVKEWSSPANGWFTTHHRVGS